MSASQSPPDAQTAANHATAADPSMEDILASIRRILSEDETPAPAAGAEPPPAQADDGVLVLDPSMLVADPVREAEPLADIQAPAEHGAPAGQHPPEPADPPAERARDQDGSAGGLVAPVAVAAAATSVGTLMRTVLDRSAQVRSNGPTIEDIVREEIRPLLKAWLDDNLPVLVERLVRAEIDRVVARASA
jgi:uncharacterized protein